jgi:hypothetical protein
VLSGWLAHHTWADAQTRSLGLLAGDSAVAVIHA